MLDGVTIWQGDCLELMRDIPDGSVDAILCDLPYGTTACKWDTVIPFVPLWAHYKRVIKRNGAIVLFGSQPFTSALVMSNPAMFRYCWVWEKSVGTGFLNAKKRPLKCHEDIAVFYDVEPTYNPQKYRGQPNHTRKSSYEYRTGIFKGAYCPVESDTSGWKYPRSVLQFGKHTASEVLHPSQKPVALMEYLIRTYTNEGETVLDNCMGSGTTGVACVNTDRRFVGIERDAGYFAIAAKRIQDAQGKAKQLTLEGVA